MNRRPEKILAIQFKYFGDAVFLTPALRALRAHFSEAQIHLLLPAEVAPVLARLPAVDRLWAMPRRRGKAAFGQTWPVIRALRREKFTRIVDFGGNDRGAVLSLAVGSPERLGWARPGKWFGCHQFYTRRVVSRPPRPHESAYLAQLLAGWEVPAPVSLEPEVHADDTLAAAAAAILPGHPILFHVAAGNSKKQWPVSHWAELYRLARAAGGNVCFTTPAGQREAVLMEELRRLVPTAAVLPPMPDLPLFLAVLKRAALFVSGDTGPLHFAAGLGVPTLSLFGHTEPALNAPIGPRHKVIAAGGCTCARKFPVCARANPCLADIRPGQVLAALGEMLPGSL
jgi:ADP-heptose:LPS heptosyltransferase